MFDTKICYSWIFPLTFCGFDNSIFTMPHGIYLFDGDNLIVVKMGDFLFQVEVERVTPQSQGNRKGNRNGEVVSVVTGGTNFSAELKIQCTKVICKSRH